MTMPGKRRTPGQWIEIAKGRSKVERDVRRGAGLTNIPKLSEHGSAAYRRLQASQAKRR